MATTPKKPRVLCLHGYMQNAEIFRAKTGSLRKALKSSVEELVFIDAPYELEGCDEGESRALGESTPSTLSRVQGAVSLALTFPCLPLAEHGAPLVTAGGGAGAKRAWFLTTDKDEDGHPQRPSRSRCYTPWATTLAHIEACWKAQGPFDCVLGFSQGACVAAMVAASLGCKVAIAISGFMPNDPAYQEVLREGLMGAEGAQCLHVLGESDNFVPNEKTRALQEAFEGWESLEFVHEGGHMVPSSKPFRDAAKEFLGRGA